MSNEKKRSVLNIIVFVALVGMFFWLFKYQPLSQANPLTALSVASTDELILLASSSCSTCDTIEPAFRRVAERAGIAFRRLEYSQKIPVPSYILIVDGVATIGSARDGAELSQQLCVTARLHRVCGFNP